MSFLRFYIRIANVNCAAAETRLLNALPKAERDYCREVTHDNARMRRILGRASILYARSQLCTSYLTLPIERGQWGKPMLKGVSFSISHR